jgi:hypothetical protein
MATDPDRDDEARIDLPMLVSGLIVGGSFADGELP